MDDEIKINPIIAGKTYRLSIKKEEEEIVRKAIKEINEKLNVYQSKYPKVDAYQSLTMVSLDIATRYMMVEDQNDTIPFTTKIEELTNELEEYLKAE